MAVADESAALQEVWPHQIFEEPWQPPDQGEFMLFPERLIPKGEGDTASPAIFTGQMV